MKCPRCDQEGFNVYSTHPEDGEDGKISVVQYRKCKACGCTAKTPYDKWVCELNSEDYLNYDNNTNTND